MPSGATAPQGNRTNAIGTVPPAFAKLAVHPGHPQNAPQTENEITLIMDTIIGFFDTI